MQKHTGPNVRALRRPAGSGPQSVRRYRANWPAELKCGGSRIPCTVLEISAGGASIKIGSIPTEGPQLWLVIDRMPPISAVLAWREKERVGLRFADEQEWVAQSYQQRFDPAAWLRENKGE
ncbi:MAG TPA: PilZ domain-containing protein [Micropepsaceae bacterium]|jgi:hypothetical protein|nr:PilZ domain-containing protein [Micropepsaceae bacterium]